MLRILACLALLAAIDTFENSSRVQSAAWNYSVHQGHEFNRAMEGWLRNWRS